MKAVKVMYTKMKDHWKGYSYYIATFSLYALETVAWHHKILYFEDYTVVCAVRV